MSKIDYSKTARNTEGALARYTRAWFTGASTLFITLIVMAGSAWMGTWLFMAVGLHWWESAPVPVTMDLMMITAAFHLRKPGATPTAQEIARKAMRFGLLTSLTINVVSSLLHSRMIEIIIDLSTGHAVAPMMIVKAAVMVGASWIPTWVLKHLVDVLTVSSARDAHAGEAPKASQDAKALEAKRAARRLADQKRKALRAAEKKEPVTV